MKFAVAQALVVGYWSLVGLAAYRWIALAGAGGTILAGVIKTSALSIVLAPLYLFLFGLVIGHEISDFGGAGAIPTISRLVDWLFFQDPSGIYFFYALLGGVQLRLVVDRRARETSA